MPTSVTDFAHKESGSGSVSCSVVFDSVTPWIVAHQAPVSMGFSRQECWSGLPFTYPEDLPNPGIEARSPALQLILYCLSYREELAQEKKVVADSIGTNDQGFQSQL